MTDKEVRAIAIKEVTYADMIAIGATEEIATAASWKARCAFEASWDCAVDKACAWLEEYAANFVALPDKGQQPIGDTNAIYGTKSLLYYLRKAMEE